MAGPILDLTIGPFEPMDRLALERLWRRVFADDPPWNAPAVMIAHIRDRIREVIAKGGGTPVDQEARDLARLQNGNVTHNYATLTRVRSRRIHRPPFAGVSAARRRGVDGQN